MKARFKKAGDIKVGVVGYGGDQIVINPDHAMLNQGRCDDHEQ